MEFFTKQYKVGNNRGNKRIWIEGKVLSDLDLKRGDRFSRLMDSETINLVFEDGDKVAHTVAGSDERPIIDLNGKYLNEFFGDSEFFVAEFIPAVGNYSKQIKIERVA